MFSWNRPIFLFVQLGTPEQPAFWSVARFLWAFLKDPRVVDIPYIGRALLVGIVIIPFRLLKVVAAYKSIWKPEGSPLRVYSDRFIKALRKKNPNDTMALAMTYDQGSIRKALKDLQSEAPGQPIIIIPLYPQYATSSTGAALSLVYEEAAKFWDPPALIVIQDFYERVSYIKVLAKNLTQFLKEKTELVVLSFHGVPIRHLEKSQCANAKGCQAHECPAQNFPRLCYRAQCYATARAIQAELKLSIPIEVVFQSRVGSLPWTSPNLLDKMIGWKARGIKHITIATPSFTVDCLETLEEIAINFCETWAEMVPNGTVQVMPCLNDSQEWVEAISESMKDLDPKLSL
jgi:ferrochelatase